MAKFNSKNEGVQPTEVNFMGEKAFKQTPMENLISTCMTTMLSGDYYETEEEKCARIREDIAAVDPLFAAKCAIYVRTVGELRSVTHYMAAVLAKYISGKPWADDFYYRIIQRPDDMSEILCAYSYLNGNKDFKNISKIPNSMKKGFKKALEDMDPYKIDKYKMKSRSVSLVDLANLFHPNPQDKRKIMAWERLMKGESLSDLYEAKMLQTEMSKAGQVAASQNLSEDERKEVMAEAISATLDNVKGMPEMALLKNLRNIMEYAPDKVDEACKQLTIEEKVLKSKILPFRFASAYLEIEKMSDNFTSSASSSIKFESDLKKSDPTNKKKVLDAIEVALQISCKNIPHLEGKTAILIDHSGSVRGDAGGSSRVSAFSKTTSAMIGNLFGSMMAYAQDDVYIGLFGDELIPVAIDRSKKLLDFNQNSYNLGAKCGGGTEAGIYKFLKEAVDSKKRIDNIIVFSDCQIGSGNRDGFTSWYGYSDEDSDNFQKLFNKFRSINPMCNWVVCNIKQAGNTSVFDKSMRILNIAGWSEKIFDVIKSNCKGWAAVIEEINSIKLE